MITICVFVRYLTYFDGLLRHRGTEPGLWEVFTSSLALDHIIITSVTCVEEFWLLQTLIKLSQQQQL